MLATADAESRSSSLPPAARTNAASVMWSNGPAYGIKAFTGREWDPEIGLYYYRARYYDPKVGRFISGDPIRFTGGINFYAYAAGNPVDLVDPLGLATYYSSMNAGPATRFGHSIVTFSDPSNTGEYISIEFGPAQRWGPEGPGNSPLKDVPGKFTVFNYSPGNSPDLDWTEIHTSPDQEAVMRAMAQVLRAMQAKNEAPHYRGAGRNCADFAAVFLRAAGVPIPDVPLTPFLLKRVLQTLDAVQPVLNVLEPLLTNVH
jgi:RHS repeat-associated protein